MDKVQGDVEDQVRSRKPPRLLIISKTMCEESRQNPGSWVEDEAYDEEGNSLTGLTYQTDLNGIRIPSSVIDDVNTLYYPPEKRTERHAEGIFNKRLRALLAQEITREFVHSLIPTKRDGPEDINIAHIIDEIGIDVLLRLLEGDYDIGLGVLLQQISLSAN
ncbi:glucagon family neuropeptides isoform X4 [Stegostoma tigrinum]|uniref:glucagon family neuropeptides isoform X4 n=1 Tax=Stegostoma tigrinum TaxID=3053191 RepID=UPI00202B5DA7|nr:glucagon family neuropeptides isoform X4 [Stegostoma tigrinum]